MVTFSVVRCKEGLFVGGRQGATLGIRLGLRGPKFQLNLPKRRSRILGTASSDRLGSSLADTFPCLSRTPHAVLLLCGILSILSILVSLPLKNDVCPLLDHRAAEAKSAIPLS
jgi:hypothetical protein